jgi:hypothetical protein
VSWELHRWLYAHNFAGRTGPGKPGLGITDVWRIHVVQHWWFLRVICNGLDQLVV